ncbi:MAG: CvpA family protein [Clostridia bacterium]|nr:CvpA family protein [Clostridia bacterium]
MSIFTIILLVIIALLALWGGIMGGKRGISRQVIRIITVVVALLISIYLAKLCNNAVMVWIGNQTAEDLAALLQSMNIPLGEYEGVLSYLDTNTLNYIIAIPLTLAIVPIGFVICFLLIKLLMLIPHALLSGIFGFSKERNNVATRIFGVLLGIVQGVLVAAVIIFPVAGALTSATEVINAVREEAPDSEEAEILSSFYEGTIQEYAEDPVIKVIGVCGAKTLYKNISTVQIKDVEYNMVETVGEPTVKIGIGVNKLWGWDWKKPTPENEDAVRAMIEAVDDSEYAKALITDVLVFASRAYEDGAIPFEFEAPMSDIVDAFFKTIGLITKETIKEDLTTLSEAYFVLARENIIYELEYGNEDATREALTKTMIDENGNEVTVISHVVSILNKNERTAHLVTVLTKLTASALANQFGADSTVLYENIKEGFNSTIAIEKEGKTKDEYTTEVSASLDTVLRDNGIELDADVVDGMAEYVYDNYDSFQTVDEDGNKTLSDQEMNNIVLSYYDAYIKAMENGELPPEIEGEIPEGEIPELQ